MFGLYSRTGFALFGAVLYGGPVLAGLARHGWSVLPVLAALFLLYVAATRKPDLSTAAGWANLGTMVVLQSVLVVVAWASGLALANLVGAVELPLWAPLAISAAAAGFGAWAFRDAAEMDVMLDSALARIAELENLAGAAAEPLWPDPAPEADQAVQRALRALRTFDDPDPANIDPVMRKLHAEAGADAFDPLYDAAGLGEPFNEPVVDFALLRFVALPEVYGPLVARGEAGLAPLLLLNAPDPGVRAEARACVTAMIRAEAPSGQLPDPCWIAELAAEFPGEGYDALARNCRRGPAAALEA